MSSTRGRDLRSKQAAQSINTSIQQPWPRTCMTGVLIVRQFLHRRLPASSALLSGSQPPDDLAFRSDHLQIWFNRTDDQWEDPAPHFHTESDEIFIVLRGAIIVEVEGERRRIGADELCAFPAGVVHSVVAVDPPVESLMIRAPSIQDKVYPDVP